MGFTKTNYTDVDDKHGLHFLREPLECEQLGISVNDVADGREGPVHDHADDGQEEVYLLLEGAVTLTVAILDVESPGDEGTVRVGLELDADVDRLPHHAAFVSLTPDKARLLAADLERVATAAENGETITSGLR